MSTDDTAPSYHLLRASAGTGKTYQLVQAYVRAVLHEGLRPHQIVAITFTRKAAAELRQRIGARLAELGCSQDIIQELPAAPIQNFHGLALHLLRQFGHEAKFPAHSQILGESGEDLELFKQCCVDAWFADAGSHRDASGTSGSTPSLRQSIETLAGHFAVETELPTALWRALSQAREDGREIDDDLLAHYDGDRLRDSLQTELFSLRQDLAAVMETQSPKAKEQLRRFLAEPLPEPDLELGAWGLAWSGCGRHLDRRSAYKSVYTQENKELLEKRTQQPAAAELCAGFVPHLWNLLNAAWTLYGQRKHNRGLVDFADLLERAVALLHRRPSVNRFVRQRIRTVLVDEAQDTNRLQRRFVHLLCGLEKTETMPNTGVGAPRQVAEPPAASLTVVGDQKQAIYTFRGADPAAFGLFAQDIDAAGGDKRTLSTSYRSGPRLVAAINNLGEHLFADYEPLTSALPESGSGQQAVVHLEVRAPRSSIVGAALEADTVAHLIDREGRDDGRPAGDFAVLLRAMTYAPLFATALARRGIAAVIGGGGGLYAQSEVGDCIALLLWLSDPYDRLAAASALRSPLIGLSDSALLCLFARDGGTALLGLRRGEWPGTAAEAEGLGLSPSDAMAVRHLATRLPRLVQACGVMGAAPFLEYADRLLDLRPCLVGLAGGEQRLANFDRVVELAGRFDRQSGGSVAAFARQQQERQRRQHAEPLVPVAAAARHAVTLTTVHQSKGMEYPVVVLADLDRRTRADRDCLRYDRARGIVMLPRFSGQALISDVWAESTEAKHQIDDDERRRLLYVAMTRAKEQIILMGRSEDPTAGRRPRRPSSDSFAGLLAPWIVEASQGFTPLIATQAPRPPLPLPSLPSIESGLEVACAAPAVDPPCRSQCVHLSIDAFRDFALCRERGRLLHIVGAEEPLFKSGPPTEQGRGRRRHQALGRAAHYVLSKLPASPSMGEEGRSAFVDSALVSTDLNVGERGKLRPALMKFLNSELGRALSAAPFSHRRHELGVRLNLELDHDRTLLLRGRIDVLFDRSFGVGPVGRGGEAPSRPTMVEFVYSGVASTSVAAYRPGTDAYAAALAQATDYHDEIDSRLVELEDGRVLARSIGAVDRQKFHRQARQVAQDIDLLSVDQVAERAPPSVCEELRCGFLADCRSRRGGPRVVTRPASQKQPRVERKSKAKIPAGQLSLFD